MTVKDFIKTIKESGNIKENLKELSYGIFHSMGLTDSHETADKWRKKGISLSGSDDIKTNRLIQYLMDITESTWKDVQEEFSKTDQYKLINCNTDDAEIFFRSLLVPFFETLGIVPVSLCHHLPPNPKFFGRSEELAQIEGIFKKNNFALLTGIGGIGKSHLALAYAHKLWESGGWTVQHIICEDSDTLRDSVNQLQVDSLTEQGKTKKRTDIDIFDHNVNLLKRVFRPTLIILDNLNKPFTPSDRDGFKKLTNCGHHIQVLITSRHKWLHDSQSIVDILPLDNDALYNLYAHHRFTVSSDHSEYITKHKDVLNKLFALVENHTLMITLLAKLPNSIFADEQEIYNRFETILNYPENRIIVTKDREDIEENIMEIIKRIFDISQLTDEEKSIMQYMEMIAFSGIEIDLFKELTRCSEKAIYNLIHNNWIMYDEEFRIKLHPLIRNTLLNFDETKITIEACNNLVERVTIKWENLPLRSKERHTFNNFCAKFLSKTAFPLIRNAIKNYYNSYSIDKDSLISHSGSDYSIDKYNDMRLAFLNSILDYSDDDVPNNNRQIGDD